MLFLALELHEAQVKDRVLARNSTDPQTKFISAYLELGLRPGATEAQIKTAYETRMEHLDSLLATGNWKTADQNAFIARMQEAGKAAYETLSRCEVGL